MTEPTAGPSQKTITMREALAVGRVTYSSWLRDAAFFIANTHVLLGLCLAHPDHPYSRCRRLLVLYSSFAFAFLLTVTLETFVPNESAKAVLRTTVGAVLQSFFDVGGALLGSCRCANAAWASRIFSSSVRAACQSFSFAILSLHCCLGSMMFLFGSLLLAKDPLVDSGAVWEQFVRIRLAGFATSLATGLLVYAAFRELERRFFQPQALVSASPRTDRDLV